MDSRLSISKLAELIDVSCVRTDVTISEIDEMIALARQYHFVCAFAMPTFTQYVVEALKATPEVKVGGVVGFPSGAETTTIKIATAKELIEFGCDELDMVSNVSALKSQKYALFQEDIRAIVETANGLPVKAILEVSYLEDDEIKRAAELAVKSGVAYVKTGTGWAAKPTTVDTIRLIKSTIGTTAKIKAAGGIRDLSTLLAMKDAGCDRFGISLATIKKILAECQAIENYV